MPPHLGHSPSTAHHARVLNQLPRHRHDALEPRVAGGKGDTRRLLSNSIKYNGRFLLLFSLYIYMRVFRCVLGLFYGIHG